jgi:hypothetical protein
MVMTGAGAGAAALRLTSRMPPLIATMIASTPASSLGEAPNRRPLPALACGCAGSTSGVRRPSIIARGAAVSDLLASASARFAAAFILARRASATKSRRSLSTIAPLSSPEADASAARSVA